LAKLRDN